MYPTELQVEARDDDRERTIEERPGSTESGSLGVKSRRRVQLDYANAEYGALVENARQAGAANVTDFVRRAVSVYKWILAEQTAGKELLVSDGDKATTVRFLFPT